MTVTLKSQFSDLFCSIDQWQEKVGAKCPKTLQSGFKSGSMWTCEGERQKRAGTRRALNTWGKLSLSQGVQRCSHLTAQNECRQMARARSCWMKALTDDYSAETANFSVSHVFQMNFPLLLNQTGRRGRRPRRQHLKIWDPFKFNQRRLQQKICTHTKTALTSCPCWGIFRADAAPRLYCF